MSHEIQSVIQHFDAAFSTNESMAALSRYISGDAQPKVKLKDLQNSKAIHSARTSAAERVAQLRSKKHLPETSQRDLLQRYKIGADDKEAAIHPNQGATSRVATMQGSEIRALRGGRQLMSGLRAAWHHGINRAYVLDGGVPYTSMDVPPSFLLVDEWPHLRSDPEKPTRAAAFGGWILATSASLEELKEMIERSREFVRKRVYERAQVQNQYD